MEMPIFNYKHVTIYSSFTTTKTQFILRSVLDASQQLLESSGYGIIAIDLSNLIKGAPTNLKKAINLQKDIGKVIKTLFELFKSMPHVSAILFFVTRYLHENKKAMLSTDISILTNRVATHTLPPDITDALLKPAEMGYKSLLAD